MKILINVSNLYNLITKRISELEKEKPKYELALVLRVVQLNSTLKLLYSMRDTIEHYSDLIESVELNNEELKALYSKYDEWR